MRQTQITKVPAMSHYREAQRRMDAEQDYRTERAIGKARRTAEHARKIVEEANAFLRSM